MNIKSIVLKYIEDQKKPVSFEELCDAFSIQEGDVREFRKIVQELVEDLEIRFTKKDKIMPLSRREKARFGTILGKNGGYAFFRSDVPDIEDVFIPGKDLNSAMNKDRVEIEIVKRADKDHKAEGRVLRIIKRNTDELVGTYHSKKHFGFVVLDDPSAPFDIYIPKKKKMNARHRDKVVVKIKDYSPKNGKPEGVIVRVLGRMDEPGVDIESIIASYDVETVFSHKALKEAKALPKEVSEADKVGRSDFRNLLTMTIDGIDARDFDDAISLEREGKDYILYVHIADVSHYVKEGAPLDVDAYKRGNSTYLADRVLPMLPVELSNGLCSLNPGVDRLAVTVRMVIDNKGQVKDYRFYESVIRSDFRLNYTEVSDYLEEGKPLHKGTFLERVLDDMYSLQKILQKKREKRGAIDFDFPESHIVVDDKTGYPLEVEFEERRAANRLIEEFMLLTNETVGQHFGYLHSAFLYRIHENPTQEKLAIFKNFIAKFGYSLKGQDVHPKDFQQLSEKIQGKKEAPLIEKMMLRTMTKAIYSEENDFHFGLATEYYTHFTSPIRRYCDLVVHRILKASLRNQIVNDSGGARRKMAKIADHISVRERVSEELERDVESYKICEYMERFVGQEFDGIISSLTNFGIFVQLKNSVEGMIPLRELKDDFYNFDEEHYVLVGERTKRTFEMGQKVRIKVLDSRKEVREIDFGLVGETDGKK